MLRFQGAVAAPFEVKFAADAATGEFSGYGAIFGNMDSHGDIIVPGAFSDTLKERKAAGRSLPMHVMHRHLGGDGLPAGVWSAVDEDDRGLKVTGKISGMNTERGRAIYELVKDGALGGLSIGYKIRKGGAEYPKEPGQPKRRLKSLDLGEISLVDDPSNPLSRVLEAKSTADLLEELKAASDSDVEAAVTALGEAIKMHDRAMSSGDYVCGYYDRSPKTAALLMQRLQDAHKALTGNRVPEGVEGWTKSADAVPVDNPLMIRAIESWAREEFSLSHSQARAVVARGFKAQPREEGSEKPTDDTAAALLALQSGLKAFSLPKG